MKILLIHNYYQQSGGEDVVVESEAALLREQAHEVVEYYRHNDEINKSTWQKALLPKRFIWAHDAVSDLHRIIRDYRPDVAHFHNTHFMISPSAYYACKAHGLPVVQTLHNFRLLCSNAVFFRNGKVCEDCLGKTPPWPAVIHGCYRDSRAQTAMIAANITFHRALKTWQRKIDCFIALTDFAREKFIQSGLPAEKIITKPNFIDPDPGMGASAGNYALFVGRLSPEKGLVSLLSAWKEIGARLPLKIVGDGPLSRSVIESSEKREGVEYLGRQPKETVFELMKNASVLIFPSLWYEGFPMVLAEAFATGLPVIASSLGSMSMIIDHKRTGLHFRPGDPGDLAEKVTWLLDYPAELAQMRQEARVEYEAKYTADRNHKMLMDIYKQAIERNR